MTAFSLAPARIAWCEELRTLAEQTLRPFAEKGDPVADRPEALVHEGAGEVRRTAIAKQLYVSREASV